MSNNTRIFDERMSVEPDYQPWTEKFIRAMQAGVWSDAEFNFQSDIQDYKVNLTPQEREIITRSLAMIAQVEVQVKRFWAKLGDNLPHASILDLGYVMANSEVIHSRAYKRLLKVLGIKQICDDITQLPIISGRTNYLTKHIRKFHTDNKKQFVYSLILFTLFVENISLFTQFYTIMWFGRYKNVLKDTNKQVEYTSKEEDLHAKVGIHIINQIRREYPELFDAELEEKVLYEAGQAVKYECEIVDWSVNGYEHNKLNSPILKELIKKRMNNSLIEIKYPTIFEIDNELIKKTDWFDECLLGNNMSDFFHGRPVEYSKKSQSFGEEDLF